MATMGITMASVLLLLPAATAANFKATAAAQATARKLRLADSAVTATHVDTRRLQQLEFDWTQPGLIYGEFCYMRSCGSEYGLGEPIDALDYCCFTHNECYGNAMRISDKCQCDRDIIKCLVDLGTTAVDQLQAKLAKESGIEFYTDLVNSTCTQPAVTVTATGNSTHNKKNDTTGSGR